MAIDVLHATEFLLPAAGGAERTCLMQLAALSERGHRVRAVWLERPGPAPDALSELPDGVDGVQVAAPGPAPYWRGKRERRQAIGAAVSAALDERRADVVVTALHAAPGVIEAARSAGSATVLVLFSYESLCKYAFDVGSECVPESGCAGCPRAGELDEAEREELLASRAAHERSLAAADRLLAVSDFVAGAAEEWCGRRPDVIPDAVRPLESARPAPDGPVLLAAAHWRENKGAALLAPLARALAPRPVAITQRGLTDEQRSELAAQSNVELRDNAPIADLLEGARALLVPSQWPEPFGRLVLEGMSAGVPTLASAVGGLPEYVPEPCLVASPGSVDAWAAAVVALDNPARREAVRSAGMAAAERVLARRVADEFERVLEAAASRQWV